MMNKPVTSDNKTLQPKVAIITRTKDRAAFLERAIRSVNSQSFTDYVHVIVNDAGNADKVRQVLNQYEQVTKNRVILINNNTSRGMEAATNIGIKRSNSKYIAIHDDDDTWHKDFLKLTVEHLENTDTDTGGVVVRTNKIVEDVSDDGSVIKLIKTRPWMPDLKAINLYRQFIDNQMTPITFIYKRQAFESVGEYNEALPVLGDWDFGIRFLLKYDVDYINPGYALANYHHRKYREGSSSNNSFSGNERHRYYANRIMNQFLREEIRTGKLGPGYIMSKTRYEQNFAARTLTKLLPSFIARYLNKKAQG